MFKVWWESPFTAESYDTVACDILHFLLKCHVFLVFVLLLRF